jgi:serine/threonine protein kinase
MTSGIAPPVERLPAAERALPAGTLLDEYEIEQVLAQSSMGLLYQAFDRVLKMHVAIQEYLPDTLALRSLDTDVMLRDDAHALSFERGRQAFVNEARMLAHCDHASLPRILRILMHHDTVYRVMHCQCGPTLREFRQAMAEAPTAASVRSLLDSLLGALAQLHQQGLVHAAVSPANILMLADHRPVLLDSDAVRAALISGRARSVMAALEPGFAPIEQCELSQDRPLGPWTDLYSLAATLHFFIGGELPAAPVGEAPPLFESLDALWQRSHDGRPAATEELPWLKALDQCLVESTRDRPQSVAQLRDLIASQDAGSRRPTWAARIPWIAAGDEPAEALGCRPPSAVATQAKDFAGLEQTLPFVVARAHQVVATSCAPALTVHTSLPALPLHPRRQWRGAALLLLSLSIVLTAGGWMRSRNGSSSIEDLGLTAGVANASARPATASAAIAAAAEPPTEMGKPEPRASVAAVVGPAAAPGAGSATPVAAGPAPMPTTPRGLCGSRSGYALYQCMQAQCAKRQWVPHAQCRRLSQDQSLG